MLCCAARQVQHWVMLLCNFQHIYFLLSVCKGFCMACNVGPSNNAHCTDQSSQVIKQHIALQRIHFCPSQSSADALHLKHTSLPINCPPRALSAYQLRQTQLIADPGQMLHCPSIACAFMIISFCYYALSQSAGS